CASRCPSRGAERVHRRLPRPKKEARGEPPGLTSSHWALSARRTIAVRLFIFWNGALLEAPFGVRWTVFHRHLRPFVRRVHGDTAYAAPRYACGTTVGDTLRCAAARLI